MQRCQIEPGQQRQLAGNFGATLRGIEHDVFERERLAVEGESSTTRREAGLSLVNSDSNKPLLLHLLHS